MVQLAAQVFHLLLETSTGPAVLSNHNNAAPHTTRSTIFIDNSPFEYNFTEYDPGATPNNQGQAIWPLLAINDNDDLVLASSINGGDSFYVNSLSNGVFGGWQIFNGDEAETHSFNFSEERRPRGPGLIIKHGPFGSMASPRRGPKW